VLLAAPIFEFDGQPVGAIAVTAPKERLSAVHHEQIGQMVLKATQDLSRGTAKIPIPAKL